MWYEYVGVIAIFFAGWLLVEFTALGIGATVDKHPRQLREKKAEKTPGEFRSTLGDEIL